MTEPTLLERPEGAIGFEPSRARDARPRDLAVRFAFGAATSIVAAVISLLFGARAGGLFMAFPAILGASLTLIAEDEDREEAREDARGAVVGALALATFAAAGAVLFGVLAGGVVLALAALVWAGVAIGLYMMLWRRR